MAEFTKVAHEWVRMCKAYSDAGDCMKCPMVTNPICGYMSDDNGASDKEISKAEADIMSWAAEHPEPVYPTWEEWLQSVGVMESSEGLLRRIQGQLLIDGIPTYSVPTSKVLQPMDADIAQKLGIEPLPKA